MHPCLVYSAHSSTVVTLISSSGATLEQNYVQFDLDDAIIDLLQYNIVERHASVMNR